MSPTICYIKWRDACKSESEHEISTIGPLAELQEIGFLIKETDESVTIGIEHPGKESFTRLWLTIPRVNIVEVRKTTLNRAFPTPRKRNNNEPAAS